MNTPMRAVVFVDVPGSTPRRVIAATLAHAHERPDFEVCGFVTANPQMIRRPRERTADWARQLLVAATGGARELSPPFDLGVLGRRTRLPVLLAENGVNDPDFIADLHRRLRPTVLLSIFSVQIFKDALLESFEQAVNFHDGPLPRYGGLGATTQAVYHGESSTGCTFHRITSGIDEGPVLVRTAVPIDETVTGTSVSRAQAIAAARAIPEVIDKIVANDPGQPQSGEGSYFSKADYRELSEVPEPSALSTAELQRRLRAFGALTITIDGKNESVDAIGPADVASTFAFNSAEARLRATRIAGLPARLLHWRRQLSRTRPQGRRR